MSTASDSIVVPSGEQGAGTNSIAIDNHEESLEALIAQRDALDVKRNAVNAKISRLHHDAKREAIKQYFPAEFAQFVRCLRMYNLALVYYGGNFKAYRVTREVEKMLCDGVRDAYPDHRGFSGEFRHEMQTALLDQVYDASSVQSEATDPSTGTASRTAATPPAHVRPDFLPWEQYTTCYRCASSLGDNQLVKDAHRVNTVASWAKQQLRVLEGMARDHELPAVFASEMKRIADGIEVLPAAAGK